MDELFWAKARCRWTTINYYWVVYFWRYVTTTVIVSFFLAKWMFLGAFCGRKAARRYFVGFAQDAKREQKKMMIKLDDAKLHLAVATIELERARASARP